MTDDELEQRLRAHYLAIEHGPAPTALHIRIGDGLTRRHRRRWLVLLRATAVVAGLFVVVAVAVALGLRPGGFVSGSPGPTATATASPTATTRAACRAADIVPSVAGWGAAEGTTYAPIFLTLRSATPCLLPDAPALALLDPTGRVVIASQGTGSAATVAVQTAATLSIGWSSWCSALPPQPLTLRVYLLGGDQLTVTLPPGFAASCMGVASSLFVNALTISSAAPGASATPTAVASLPPGGITIDHAKALAMAYAPLAGHLVAAAAGQFGALSVGLYEGPSSPIASSRLVWAITYASTAVICGSLGSPCESPRAGTVTVFLDYHTGAFLAGLGSFPNPD